MRRDVLEVMAEEIAGRPVDALASFTTWDEGRRKLDGMSRGRRWDIDREQRDWEQANAQDIRRLVKIRARRRNPELYRQMWTRWEAAHRAKRAAEKKAWRRKYRARFLAIQHKSYDKHKAKRRADALAYYHAHRPVRLAKMKAWDRASRPREGRRKCSVCRKPGHNRRRCPQNGAGS